MYTWDKHRTMAGYGKCVYKITENIASLSCMVCRDVFCIERAQCGCLISTWKFSLCNAVKWQNMFLYFQTGVTGMLVRQCI